MSQFSKEHFRNFKVEYSFLLIIILISFYRSPFIFLNGIFVGEEASQYFLFALNNSFLENISYYIPLAGYYNVIPNILTEIATYLPIEYAPMSTVYGSFIIFINLIVISLFCESHFLQTKNQKIILSLILLFSPPFVPEIWLNSLNSQIYLCLTSILILFIKQNNNSYYFNFNIFLASLSGIYSCTLLPLFLLRYYYFKTRYDLTNLIIIMIGTIIQISIIIYSKFSNALLDSKLEFNLDINIITNFIYNCLAKPIIGRQFTHWLYENLNLLSLSPNSISIIILIIVFLIFILFLKNKEILKKVKKDYILLSLISIFVTISILILIGSVGTQMGGRYAVLPGCTFLLILFRLTNFSVNSKTRILCSLLLSFSLISGIYEFRPPTKNVKHQYIRYLDCINCPIWKEEIKKWKKDQNYMIGIWPYPRKNFYMKVD